MAIVNTGDWPCDPNTTTGTDLAERLSRQFAAIVSSNLNPTRPAYLTAGAVWSQSQPGGGYKLFFFDGTKDHEIGQVDAAGVGAFGGGTALAPAFSATATYAAGQIIYDAATGTYLQAKNANGPGAYNAGDWQSLTDVFSAKVSKTGDSMSGPLSVPILKDINGNTKIVTGGFYKSDPTSVCFTKTGNGTAAIKAGTMVAFADGSQSVFAAATNITMPSLVAGSDYAIWVGDSSAIQASSNHTSPPGSGNWRKIGGFHYAPGSNATGQSGGDATPQINEYSFWDLKFKPSCPDPRGMTLVANAFWIDIYLTGVDAITNGSSKYNVLMADGASPPKIPTMFGGSGSNTYGSYTWFEAMELAVSFGKRAPTQREFMAAAYGTTEATSIGADQNNTILNQGYTSKWGVIQSTGILWIWGDDRGGAYPTTGWDANTKGRGSEYNAPNAVLLGGYWANAANSGSRCSLWGHAASDSNGGIGSRFACDHLQLD
jgi:hypothetical protein